MFADNYNLFGDIFEFEWLHDALCSIETTYSSLPSKVAGELYTKLANPSPLFNFNLMRLLCVCTNKI